MTSWPRDLGQLDTRLDDSLGWSHKHRTLQKEDIVTRAERAAKLRQEVKQLQADLAELDRRIEAER